MDSSLGEQEIGASVLFSKVETRLGSTSASEARTSGVSHIITSCQLPIYGSKERFQSGTFGKMCFLSELDGGTLLSVEPLY